jgi:hypothetical protein
MRLKNEKKFILIFQVLNGRFGPSNGLTFASWMAFCVPLMALNLFLAWIWLQVYNWRPNKTRKNSQVKYGFIYNIYLSIT